MIDADGSGTLQLQEVVQGLLKIRGDLTKSDTVAALLATKSMQNQVVQMKRDWILHFEALLVKFTQLQMQVQLELQSVRGHQEGRDAQASFEPKEPNLCFQPELLSAPQSRHSLRGDDEIALPMSLTHPTP